MYSFLQLLGQQVNLLQPLSSTIFVLFFFTPFLIKWLFFNNPKTLKNLPPSPPKLPIIGNLHQIGKYPHRSLQKLSQRYGPIMFFSLGNSPAIIVSSPEGAREIMKTHDLIFVNRPESRMAKKLLYNMKGVSQAPYGEYWRQLKSIYTLQLLSKKRVQSFGRVREEEIRIMMEKIKDQSCGFSKPVNLSEMISSLSIGVVSKAVFGRKYNEGENGKLRKLLEDIIGLLETGNVEDFLPWLGWINRVKGRNAKADRVAREMDEFLKGVVGDRLDCLEGETRGGNYNYEKSDGEVGENFVDILVGIHKNKEASITLGKENVKAIILNMFGGGTDTTASSLDWTMTELLRHPRIMKKLQDEVRGIAKGKQNIEEDDIENMHYLKAVIKETLRCYPPAPILIPRKSSQDVQVMGYDIPVGSIVIINAWAIARDPAFWKDPEEFKPERFFNTSIDFKGQNFEFLPFGSGRRGCPGIAFAMATFELALANIVDKFDWALPFGITGEDLDMTESIGLTTHRKSPLFVLPTLPSP